MIQANHAPSALHATIAYDPADGRILRAHFTKAAAGTLEAEAAKDWVLSVAPAHAKVLSAPPGSMEAGKGYRVDVATGTLVVEEGGVGGASGETRVG